MNFIFLVLKTIFSPLENKISHICKPPCDILYVLAESTSSATSPDELPTLLPCFSVLSVGADAARPAESASEEPASSDDEEDSGAAFGPTLEHVLSSLGLQDYIAQFESEKIDMESLVWCLLQLLILQLVRLIYPFTPKTDQFQISPAASPEI